MHPNFLSSFYQKEQKCHFAQTAAGHHLSLSSPNTDSEREKLSNFFTGKRKK
jgi:hypothetical protein